MSKRKNMPAESTQKKSKVEATPVDLECINNIRVLGAEQPFAANSGHPGAPMGCAPMAHALFGYAMNYVSSNPKWINRDRFILSNGHACALLYSMLHITGYKVTLDDLKNFRKPQHLTPGHPECFVTPGVEVSTGPLGQGISNSVGFALMSHHYEAVYNKEDFPIFNNYTYVICGDGCLQEGVSSEASSLAGHLKLNRLIVLYDSNNITIDGECSLAFTENVKQRYEAYNWKVLTVDNGNESHIDILHAIEYAKENHTENPTLIIVHTKIGYGSSKEGTEKVHGAPLAKDDLNNVKTKFGFNPEESFVLKDNLKKFYEERKNKLYAVYKNWIQLYFNYKQKYPNEAKEIERRFSGESPEKIFDEFKKADTLKASGSRVYGRECLNTLFNLCPEIIGGSADLKDSNKVDVEGKDSKDYKIHNFINRYIRFGVREHGMFAIANGMFGYGGCRPFVSTFLNFLTYGYPSLRLAALSKFSICYIMTHDSIDLGEDGPTHQPVEVLHLIRALPNCIDVRPCDYEESIGAYMNWIHHKHSPIVISLSRGNCPVKITNTDRSKVMYGAYIIKDFDSNNNGKKVIVASSGTEVDLCIQAATNINQNNNQVNIRIVSMPSWYLFSAQDDEYKNFVFPKDIKKLFVEPYTEYGYEKYFDDMIGMKSFGLSGSKNDVAKLCGFTVDFIKNRILYHAGINKEYNEINHEDLHPHNNEQHPYCNQVADFSLLQKK